MSEKVKLKLKKSVQQGSETLSELEFREPLGGDLRDLPIDLKSGDLLDLGGKLCGHPPSVMNKLSAKDTMRVLELVAVFIEGGPVTGDN